MWCEQSDADRSRTYEETRLGEEMGGRLGQG